MRKYIQNATIVLGFAFCLVFVGILSQVALAGEGAQAATHSACGQTCNSCAKVCADTLSYCKAHGGAEHRTLAHLKALEDCIATCKLSESMISRQSALSGQACALCATACKSCAASCDEFKGDKKMQACADECRKCEATCEHMAH